MKERSLSSLGWGKESSDCAVVMAGLDPAIHDFLLG
jgi:hypothetical protein